MKKFILSIAILILAFQLPAPTILTISALGNGFYQIVAPGNSDPILPPLPCVLQSSTNLIMWTSISTNTFPFTGVGYGVTNIVQATDPAVFFRVITLAPTPIAP
jgi:hypothetical protein